MVQRSDDNGDKRSHSKSSESGASPEAEADAVKALRDSIRQANAAATSFRSDPADNSAKRSRPPESRDARAISLTPPLFGAPVLNSNPIGVPWPAPPAARNRSLSKTRVGLGAPPPKVAEEVPATAPQAAPASQSQAAPALPAARESGDDSDDPVLLLDDEPDTLEVPMPPVGARPGSGRSNSGTGLPTAVQRELAGDPADEASLADGSISDDELDSLALSTARTQPMPRVRNAASLRAKAAVPALAPATERTPTPMPVPVPMPVTEFEQLDEDPEEMERRRLELATTRKTQGLLRAPDAAGSHVGRYSVHDVSAEYVDTGVPDSVSDESTLERDESRLDSDAGADGEDDGLQSAELGAGAELEGDNTRPRRSTPKQRVGHRRSSRPELGHGRVERGTKRTDPGIRARTLRGGGSGASPPPMAPPSLPPSNPPAPARVPVMETSTIVVDPSLTWPPRPAAPRPAQRASSYVPLPRDREAYEAFLRSAAGGEGLPARARPIWAQQETALIPREVLEQFADADAHQSRSKWLRGGLGIGLIVLSAPIVVWLFSAPDRQPQALPVTSQNAATSPQTSTPSTAPVPQLGAAAKPVERGEQRATTLVSTEPSGAEMLSGGAVIGNTPLEVARPVQGEELYLLRLRGFESQMVKVTATSRETMHISLLPGPEPPRGARR